MKKIILASASPRRKQILEDNGLTFDIIPANINESDYENLDPLEMVKTLSRLKAEKIAHDNPGYIVLGADSTVDLNGEILSKPRGLKHAKEMLRKLSGAKHRVITGFTIINNNESITDYELTIVKFKKLSDKQIDDYVNNHNVLDKAGSYGIHDGAGGFVEKIDGDYLNVVGLPKKALTRLRKILE